MTALYIVLAVIGVAILGLIAVVLIRAINFKPKDNVKVQENEENFDGDKVISNLQQLVRCKTVSYTDSSKEDDAEFEKLYKLLPTLYPNVYKKCSLKTDFTGRGLLFKWEGKKHEAPTVLMAHYDVVPVVEKLWDKPPFEGIIENDVLWGRGSIDTKLTFNGALSAADHLISQGYVPENDIYLAFSGGEEINGPGAPSIVDWFESQKITPALVVDEGGAVVEGVFPGVKEACGMIGIAEKGMINLQYKVKSPGGHASAPRPNSPIPQLAKATMAIENNPFPYHITKPVAEMYDTLGRRSNFVYRMIFANLWLFSGLLDSICRKSGGQLNALMRTTVAFTQQQGSSAENVIPPEATMVTNIRLNPEDSVASAKEYIEKTINNPNVELTTLYSAEPSVVSETYCEAWDKVATAVASTWKGCIVSPYIMVQCSDSRHYGRISNHVYRFSAADMTQEEMNSIHGNNEKIRTSVIKKAVEFYIRLIKQC